MTNPISDIRTVEVCFSPRLFPDILTRNNFLVVLVDILRATTSICAAFDNGVRDIIPVSNHEEARDYKLKGYLVATEQDGKKLDFADFGNSAFNFTPDNVGGKTLVYCTTNGTRALAVARDAAKIAMGAFTNLSALTEWIIRENSNVVILCSGWKNKFCIEDSLFAGALAEKLMAAGHFTTHCDSAQVAVDLWHLASGDLLRYIEKAAHRHRLKRLGLDDVIPFSFTIDSSRAVPVFEGEIIVDKRPVGS